MKTGGFSPRSTPLLYPILFAYLWGVTLASQLVLSRSLIVAMMGGLVGCTLFAVARTRVVSSLLFWVGVFFFLGILTLQIQLHPPSPPNHVSEFAGRERITVEGTVTRPPERSAKRSRLHVKAETVVRDGMRMPVTGTILVSLPDFVHPFNYGDRIRFASRLRQPNNFNNPGGFDYCRYLAKRGIWTTAFVDNPRKIVRVTTGQGNALRAWLETIRNRIRAFWEAHSTPSSRPILNALILGERGSIPESVREDFAVSGAAHILAISGLHLGIIAFFLFRGLLWVLRRSERIALTTNIFKLTALLTIPPIIFHTLIAGARVTTVRATVMIIIYLLSILLDRPRHLYYTLALAALVITLFDPASLIEASFQLSFMAVLAILFLFPRLSALLRRDEILPSRQKGVMPWLVSRSRDLLIVSVAAIIGTCPIIVYHFHRFSPMGLVSNFFVIPILGFLAVPAALVSTLLSFCSVPIAAPIASVTSWLIDLAALIIHGLASLPGASFHLASPTLLEIVLFYAFVAVIFHIRHSRSFRIALIVILCLGAVDAAYWLLTTRFYQTLRITAVDVGQGDCTLR